MAETALDRGELDAALVALLGPGARSAELRKLGAGLSNASYLATLPDRKYVLRVKQPSVGATLGLVEEFELLRAAAAAGLTAEPLRMDAATGAILTRFLPGAAPWSAEAARAHANIARIADLLRRLHGVPVKVREFEPLRYAEKYCAAAAEPPGLSPRDRRLAAELSTLAADHAARYRPSVVCHNDLVPENILDDEGELKLVDFEYAALASPVLDLASLAAMNDYDRSQCRELIHAYFMTRAAPISVDEFAKVVRLARLLAYFWALASLREEKQPDARYLSIDAVNE